MQMEEPVANGKMVELKYKVIDAKSKAVLTEVDFPIGYVHGVNARARRQVARRCYRCADRLQ